jgi:dienelactone hydrolase
MLSPLILVFFAASSQLPEDPGSHQITVRDVQHYDNYYSRGNVSARVYYPSSGGPYPLVAFMHGWTGSASDYDLICEHMASWGFVVYSNNTETSFFGSMQPQAADTRAGLQWVEDQSQDPNSWLFGLTANQPWTAIGHSMGGASVAFLAMQDARVEHAVMYEPYKGTYLGGSSAAFNWFPNYQGSLLVIGASLDDTTDWSTQVRPWFDNSNGFTRKNWMLITGGNHYGATDNASVSGGLSGAEQHALHRRLTTTFLTSEVTDEQDAYFDFFATTDVTFESEAHNTPLWATMNPNNPSIIEIGSFYSQNDKLRIAGSTATSFTQTAFGDLFLDTTLMRVVASEIVGPSGLVQRSIPISSAYSGVTLYFQALGTSATNGVLSPLNEVIVP